MKSTARGATGRGVFNLIEEGTHLLRTAPGSALASYYVGSLPFALGFLYFCADMGRSPFARRHVIEAALGLAALFVWMKFWQSLFARQLRAHLSGEPTSALTPPEYLRLLAAQATVQPIALFVLPLALVTIAGFPWACAFFQNVTALGCDDSGGLRPLTKRAARLASLWFRQNMVLLVMLLAFGLFVFLNWTIVCLTLPGLLKTLLGVETVFSKAPLALANTTFLTAMLALTYLSVDPLLKAVYVLRCFYGESVQTGLDIKVSLKSVAQAASRVTLSIGFCLLLLGTGSVSAAEPSAPENPTGKPAAHASVSAAQLDRSLGEVLQQNKYVWRLPRETVAEKEELGTIGRFLEQAREMVRKWLIAARDWLADWLKKLFRRDHTSNDHDRSGYGWMVTQQALLYGLVIIVGAVLGLLLYRTWRDRQRRATAVTAEAVPAAPDIADENVSAEQLPEDGWTRMARELLEKGELRLALRAFYLASLSHLAGRNLITLAKFKSNRDYEHELQRRAHVFAGLLAVFGENVAQFDRVWYGLHDVNAELVQHFAANVEQIKAGG